MVRVQHRLLGDISHEFALSNWRALGSRWVWPGQRFWVQRRMAHWDRIERESENLNEMIQPVVNP